MPQPRHPSIDGAGRVVPDNAAAEAFFSSLEWEVLSRNQFRDTLHARAVVFEWCYTFYNHHQRRHTPTQCCKRAFTRQLRGRGNQTGAGSGLRNPPRSRGNHRWVESV